MTNVVLISNGTRPRLLGQCLRTLYANTPADQFNLTLVCDGPLEERYVDDRGPLDQYARENKNRSRVTIDPPCHIVGRLKNLGAYWSEKQFGRGEWLMFIDDDIYFFPEWLEQMKRTLNRLNQFRLLGGVRHPYHGVNKEVLTFDPNWRTSVHLTDAVAGYCHFMRWSTWDKFGPYDSHAKGTGQSEDYALCRKIVDAGGKVGYLSPACMAHAGITNSEGKPILGGDQIERVPGVLYL